MKLAWFDQLEEGLIAFLLAVMTCITFMQVIARYVFNYSFVWALELVIILIGGWIYVRKMYDIGILLQDLPVPQWVPRAVLPLGFGLLALRFAQVLFRIVTGREAHLLGDEAEEALKLRARMDDNPPPKAQP